PVQGTRPCARRDGGGAPERPRLQPRGGRRRARGGAAQGPGGHPRSRRRPLAAAPAAGRAARRPSGARRLPLAHLARIGRHGDPRGARRRASGRLSQGERPGPSRRRLLRGRRRALGRDPADGLGAGGGARPARRSRAPRAPFRRRAAARRGLRLAQRRRPRLRPGRPRRGAAGSRPRVGRVAASGRGPRWRPEGGDAMRALAPRFVPAPAAPPPAAPQRELSGADAFREALFVLRRRKWAIVGTLVLVMAAAILGVTRLVPVYTATAVVSVGERKMQVMDLENVLSGLRTDEETIQTEVQVLVSNRVLRDTVRDLHLDRIPELNRSLEGPPSAWRAALGSLEARAAALLRPRGAPPAALPATPADGADAAGGADDATPAEIRTMSAVRARLRVEPIG